MRRVLLLAATTGYQTRAFEEGAARLGIALVYATDRCDQLDDPWADAAIAIRFHDEDASVAAILERLRLTPVDGVLAVGDRPVVIAARVAMAAGLPFHPPEAAATSCHKTTMRECLRAAGLPVPWFREFPIDIDPAEAAGEVPMPCVLKPVALSGSRGVIRADDATGFVSAFERIRALLESQSVRGERYAWPRQLLVESFIGGPEFAVEGLMTDGRFRTLAIFDKPDPLDGPFFEETIYVTPSRESADVQERITRAVSAAAQAFGLSHGPVHAECRLDEGAVFVLEAAARPIGGLCARALRFVPGGGTSVSLEEVLLRHAVGESVDTWHRETSASGVMMMPIPRRGVLRRVSGVDRAAEVHGVDDVQITARPDQTLVPLPEGASYLGFIFASRTRSDDVIAALRAAYAQLEFVIDSELRVVRSAHG